MPPRDQSNTIAHELLSRAHSPDTAIRIHTEKVIQRPLHLKPTAASVPSTAQQARRLIRERKQALKKQKPKPLSARRKRALQLYTIPKAAQKYETYLGLRDLWQGYIRELLGLEGEDGRKRLIGAADAAKLCSADFHGAELEVVRSRCVDRVGIRGIVVKDTMHVFEVVTKGDKVKILPKEGTVFRFWVDMPKTDGKLNGTAIGREEILKKAGKAEAMHERKNLVFELHGEQFKYRAADRANRKFKPHFLKDI